MSAHTKQLAFTVCVDKPNPYFARLLQQAIGGIEGEMTARRRARRWTR